MSIKSNTYTYNTKHDICTFLINLMNLVIPGGGKLVTIFSYSIAKHSHVMYRTRPSSHNKYKPHIKVTDSQHILRRISMSSHVLKHLFRRQHTNRNMCAIYCTANAIIKIWTGTSTSLSGMDCPKLRIFGFYNIY